VEQHLYSPLRLDGGVPSERKTFAFYSFGFVDSVQLHVCVTGDTLDLPSRLYSGTSN
jgi:hypothetical protein